MRTPLIAGNWKLHKTPAETAEFILQLAPRVTDASCEIAVAPSFPCLDRAARALTGTNIGLAAQNVFWEAQGAYTGEVAPEMLSDLGVKYVIVGHSERRQYFGETDRTVNKRIRAALGVGLIPIVCVGETLEERETACTENVINTQFIRGLDGLTVEQAGRIVLAYEPVWAIGTGHVATIQQAQEIHSLLRGLLAQCFSKVTAEATRIIYGGSVKPENAAGLLSQCDIDGALVGGASLIADDFAAICHAASR